MGLFSRLLGALALGSAVAGGALIAPVQAAAPAHLETEFDAVFAAKKGAPAISTPAAPKPAPAKRASSATVVPLFAQSQPASRAASPFEAAIAALAEGSQGRIGLAALDLDTGRSIAVLGNQPFPMASTSKVAIVATYLAGVDAGRFTLDQQFPLMLPVPSKRFAGDAAPVRPGAMMSATALIEAAITRSDNQATDALLAAVGGPAVVTRWVQKTAGIPEFRLDRTIATLVRDDGAVNPATMIDKRDSITPTAMVRLLSGLNNGQWLSPQSRAVLLGAMGRTVTGRHRMRALLPEGVQVAHKTGTLYNTASDIGFMTGPDGHRLAVAIYVTGQGDKGSREARIATLARAIYDGYQSEEPSQRRTALR
ncbi:MAG: class beta-lactamase [Pseudomonadota bacterium]|jgi:beta-lactamase class A